MKFLSRDFTRGEKLALLGLILVLMGLAYYNFVDQVVRRQMEEAIAERDQLQADLVMYQSQLSELQRMDQELNDLDGKGSLSYMPSYNNFTAEMSLLNTLLMPADQYSISFSNVTRDGDTIRRAFALQYTVPNFRTARSILWELANGEYRCLLGDISYGGGNENSVSINVSCTFFETMVGGVPDENLPAG